jgi:hypothetical protein
MGTFACSRVAVAPGTKKMVAFRTPGGEMRKLSLALYSALMSVSLFGQGVQPVHTQLKVGDVAPDFELPATTPPRAKVKLSDFRGKFNVVLAFFPAAFTGG